MICSRAGCIDLNGGMASSFNRRHGRSGHLVQGRYGAKRVDDEAYLLRLVAYLALNPERARLCRRSEQWPWTNYGRLLDWPDAKLTPGDRRVLQLFGSDRTSAVRRLRRLRRGRAVGAATAASVTHSRRGLSPDR